MRELELGLDLGISHSGYRLSYFQLYNWGTFDKHIVNITLDGENTLLTGSNGSGKTTLVDALLTLIVPTNDRTYNLSSGHDGKNGRTEESYVLGAYSTGKSETDYTASRKTLRDKNCHSILLATFKNKTAISSITLMQIRYFSSNGSLKRQYFIIEGDLTIEMLNEKNVGYNTGGNWIQDLKKAFPDLTITSYDTFKRYSYDFSKKFGFRYKDKAIKIFSQTVGMKDLHDLNSFIRDRMLDESDSFENFNVIAKNFNNLMVLKNQIDKEELQIEMLEEISKLYTKYQYFSTKRLNKEKVKNDFLPIWANQAKLKIINEEIERETKDLSDTENEITNKENEKNQIEDSIAELQNTLNTDERQNRINSLLVRRKDLNNTISQMQSTVDSYSSRLNNLNLEFPQSEKEFNNLRDDAINKVSILENKIEKLQEDKDELTSLKNTVVQNLENINNQLIAIENKQSNIPLEYLEIRDEICNELGLPIEDVKFFGELIRVKENSLDKALALESLIRPLALSLIVLPQHALKIADYLYYKELNKKIEIIIIEEVNPLLLNNGEDKDQLNIFDDTDEIIFEEESCPTFSPYMLEVKEDYPHRAFIEKLLHDNYNHAFSSNKDIVLSSANTFGEKALLNINNKFIKGITNENLDIHILGWEIEKKKLRLQNKIQELSKQLKDFERDIEKQKSLINKTEKIRQAYIYISQFNNYSTININQYTTQIQNIDNQILELKNESSDLDELNQQLEIKKEQKNNIEKEIVNLYKKSGGTSQSLKEKEKEKIEINNFLYNKDLTSSFEPVSQLQTEYELPSSFSDLKEINHYLGLTDSKILKEINALGEEERLSEKDLLKKLTKFKSGDNNIRLLYPSWSSDTEDLDDNIDSIEAYEFMLNKLKTDSLPKYKEQFANLRTRQIQQDITDLNSSIREWNRKIKDNIEDLNKSLDSIDYQKDPHSKIRITMEVARDKDIRKFRFLQKKAEPDPGIAALGEAEKQKANENFILAVQEFVTTLKENETFARKVLDIRNWYQFGVEEYNCETNEQIRFYKDSSAISGGQKAKLAYTILAAAIAHQFDVFNFDNSARSFRFVIVDEAFSKSDDENSRYAMDLFKAMDLQLMVVTPMDKVNLVEPYIKSVQITVCKDGKHSFVHSIKKEELKNVDNRSNKNKS